MIGIYFTNEEAGTPERLVAMSKDSSDGVKNYVTGFGSNIADTYSTLYLMRKYKTEEDRRNAVNQMEKGISDDGLSISIYRNLLPYKPLAQQDLKLVARFRFQPFSPDDLLWNEMRDEIEALS